MGEMPDSLDSFLPNFEMDQPTNGGGPSGGKTPWGPIDGGKAPWEPSDGGKGPSFQVRKDLNYLLVAAHPHKPVISKMHVGQSGHHLSTGDHTHIPTGDHTHIPTVLNQ